MLSDRRVGEARKGEHDFPIEDRHELAHEAVDPAVHAARVGVSADQDGHAVLEPLGRALLDGE